MSGHHLKCDLRDLEAAAASLTSLVGELRGAGDLADDARSAVGHARLSGKLDHFADGWKVRRQDLVEDLQHLEKMTTQAVRTYREVDAQLASAFGCS